MEICSPEKMGIKSENILSYIQFLEKSRFATHDVLIMRGGKLIYEAYWKPFNKDFRHRMYSVSKSFVAIAIGFLKQEGKLSIDDKISKYFADELKNQPDMNMHNQTIRHMLMMSTSKVERYWFEAKPDDRVRFYFENDKKESRPSGTIYQYDSTGSFILGVLVEKLSGMTLIDYLRERLFDKIGVSRDAYFLKCPGGHSWGDSALLCTPRDLMKVAQFMMQKGKWNGDQILEEKFAEEAVSKLIDNSGLNDEEFSSMGYGYLIWRTLDNSFFFNGMGCQLAICVPDKDIVLVYNADNQGKDEEAKKMIINSFFEMIVRTAADEELPEKENKKKELEEYTSKLKLLATHGKKNSPVAEKINGKTYVLNENNMGITKIKITFNDKGGILYYSNAQGDKELAFKMNENEFTKFPQDGYADEIGTVPGNRRYDCAVSASWVEEHHIVFKVQVIDKYFGVLHMHFSFLGNTVGIRMLKTAEDFLDEYEGFAGGICENY